jgi:hypothetical protein
LSIVTIVLATTIADIGAQRSTPARAVTTLTPEQALPLTCVQAWVASGRQYAEMRTIVTTLVKVSLVNRGLTLPNTRETGLEAGKAIAEECKGDPNALLFAVVDKQVRRVGTPASH